MPIPGEMRIFVSYAGPDRPWAEWAAATLEADGHSVELDVWDWAPGDNVVLAMSDALARADVVVSLWSPAYFDPHRFTADEWTAVMAYRPDERTRLVPVRVAEVTPLAILKPLLYRDVFGQPEARARAILLAAVRGASGRGETAPYPDGISRDRADGLAGPRVPGTVPRVWRVPGRNPAFTGRKAMLAALHASLNTGMRRGLVQALNGMGGVGKTQLAIEYAHLFAGEYDLVWWVDAVNPELIGAQFTQLAVTAGWVEDSAPVAVAWQQVSAQLRRAGRRLLVYDNVEEPEHLHEWLPPEEVQVIITSRHHGFAGLATPVEVRVFTRAESVDLLGPQLHDLAASDADRLATSLGDLPLAVAQAAGLLAHTHMNVDEYLCALDTHTQVAELLDEGQPKGYPLPLAAAIQTTLARLEESDPAAVAILHVAAVLAPEPIRLDWIRTPPSGPLLDALNPVANRDLTWRKTLARISDLGLATISADTILVHRLTQAVLRDQHTPDELHQDHEVAAEIVRAAEPDDSGTDPTSWPAWSALLPHLLALDPAKADPIVRHTACNGLWYLLMIGQHATALVLAQEWRDAWCIADGRDNEYVRWVTSQLATAHRYLGHHQQARDLHQETLDRALREHGPDHLNTLRAANNLGLDLRALGDLQQARDLHRETLALALRAPGPDDRDTLRIASNLGRDLQALGDLQQAHELDKETFLCRSDLFGPDDPETLVSANNLGVDLTALGKFREARDLDEDTLQRRTRVLGGDHPDTLRTANNLGVDLMKLGECQQAHDLFLATFNRCVHLFGRDHPLTGSTGKKLAAARVALGHPPEPVDHGDGASAPLED